MECQKPNIRFTNLYLSNNFSFFFFFLRFAFAALDFSFIAGSFLFTFFNLQDEEFGKRVLRIRGISTGAKKFVWREDRIQRSGFLFCFGRMKDGELFANFFDGNEKETTLDERKNTSDYEKARFEAGSTHSFATGTAKEQFRLSIFAFFLFFVLRWTWERLFGWENCKTRLLIFGVLFVRDHTKIEDYGLNSPSRTC